ncbi:Transcriptional regulator PadR-like family protein [Paramicrobacterium humi]|jgi:DNA-binding PadR family transcriptional regulator|uniref:Transcriptional regulator PadR-like family protein n=1 Tax=Paramicrobacterium humi TaxID=640635 RepID=A0A1H4QGC3_9MICO|nr:PadR family transcriptional regulator [Microbacterium humi]SEC18695.1 Transcriptional regulator PadR-like family protein [Microbacterium humi]
MTVKHSLLALLTLGPAYGLQLRDELVARAPHRTGINVGQVYGTLDRLQKAGHIISAGVTDDNLPLYTLTDGGREEAQAWLSAPSGIDALDWTEMLDQVLVCSSVPGAPWRALVADYRRLWLGRAGSPRESEGPQAAMSARAVAESARAAVAWLDAAEQTFSGNSPAAGFSRRRPRRGRPALVL